MNKEERVSRLILVIAAAVAVLLALGWGVWAYPVFQQQQARASAFYSAPRNFMTAYGTNDVQVGVVKTKPRSVQQFMPPEFGFEVSVDATVGGVPKRDGFASIGHAAGFPSGTYVSTNVMWPADLARH